MTYPTWEEYRAEQQQREAARSGAFKQAQQTMAKEIPSLIQGFEAYEADPLVSCPYNLAGDAVKTTLRQSQCKQARDAWEKKNHPENYYFFRPAVEGLTKIGDTIAEASSMLPGVGKVVAETYKQFAPSTSQYYDPTKSTTERLSGVVSGLTGTGKRKLRGGIRITPKMTAYLTGSLAGLGTLGYLLAINLPEQQYGLYSFPVPVGAFVGIVAGGIHAAARDRVLTRAQADDLVQEVDDIREQAEEDGADHIVIDIEPQVAILARTLAQVDDDMEAGRLSEGQYLERMNELGSLRNRLVEDHVVIEMPDWVMETYARAEGESARHAEADAAAEAELIAAAQAQAREARERAATAAAAAAAPGDHVAVFVNPLHRAAAAAVAPEHVAIEMAPMPPRGRGVGGIKVLPHPVYAHMGELRDIFDFYNPIDFFLAMNMVAQHIAGLADLTDAQKDELADVFAEEMARDEEAGEATEGEDAEMEGGIKVLPVPPVDEILIDRLLDIFEFYQGYDFYLAIAKVMEYIRDMPGATEEEMKDVADEFARRLARQQDDGEETDEEDAIELEGAGFFGDIWSAAKAAVQTTVAKVAQRVKDISRGVRNDYPPSVRKMLSIVGNRPVVEMYVRRDPIQGLLHKALNLVTLGKWEEMRQRYAYDRLFHLGVEVVLKADMTSDVLSRYVIEKNEVINVSPAKGFTKDTETIRIPLSEGYTINGLLEKTKQYMGDKYFTYDAFTNNCQDFIVALLTANGLAEPRAIAFAKQPIDMVLKGLPSYTQTVARAVTDVAAVANVALEGRGAASKRFAKQLAAKGVSAEEYLKTAKAKAKAAGYDADALTFSDDKKHKLQLTDPKGRVVRFGAVGLGDFILYTLAKDRRADKHRKAYLARATKIEGNWRRNKYSPNNLAIRVLW